MATRKFRFRRAIRRRPIVRRRGRGIKDKVITAAKFVLPIVAGVLAAKAGARSSIGQAWNDKASEFLFDKGASGLKRVYAEAMKKKS